MRRGATPAPPFCFDRRKGARDEGNFHATKRADGSLALLAINKSATAAISAKIAVAGLMPNSTAEGQNPMPDQVGVNPEPSPIPIPAPHRAAAEAQARVAQIKAAQAGYFQAYYAKHKAKIAARAKAYYARNKLQFSAQARAYAAKKQAGAGVRYLNCR